ncbi:MAG: hypothetical protein JRH10_14235 [Deltaproteobacteria bacterium]|nr:hypothetical protein [Deltaproteobacteria bacterium]MBW2447741.1 hypothetical protein [Deltaproteobacteria bacterium]
MTKPRGLYKISNRPRSVDATLDPVSRRERRVERIVESLRAEIIEGNGGVRIRRIFENPRELFRLELELPELGYQRTTLLDREALDALLAADDVRSRVRETS